MTITELYFYAFAMFILFLTPGPVWIVLLARIFSNGWAGGFPLALGVIIADFTWSSFSCYLDSFSNRSNTFDN